MRGLIYCFFILLLVSCHSAAKKDDNKISVRLSNDSQSVYISGLDYSVLQEMKKDSLSLQSWQGIFPVYRMPVDTDMKDMQPEQPGTYLITDSTITFKPDSTFIKHQQYFARFYGSTSNFSTSNLIRSKTNLKGQNFIEVVFRF